MSNSKQFTRPADYYEDFDLKGYDEVLFRDGIVLQGRELNNIQKQAKAHVKGIADALFADGDIVRDAQIVVDVETGHVLAQSGALYLDGAVRGVPEASFTIPTTGIVVIGVYLTCVSVSEKEDPSLYNPAVGNRGEAQKGAWRLAAQTRWGVAGEEGKFYPVHTVEDGIPRPKEAPPTLDSFYQGIAKYDRDSTGGGSYVVEGLNVIKLPDTADGKQVYSVSEGRARVNGYGLDLTTSRRLVYPAEPDVRHIDTEVHKATGEERQRVTISRAPAGNYQNLRIHRQTTATILHGMATGIADDLPNTSVVEIVRVKQGDTVYTPDEDYFQSGDRVDWSPGGLEPASGSSYEVTYIFIDTVEPENPDHLGFWVSDAVAGMSIMVNYDQRLPRYDRLVLNADGSFNWITGVAAERNPRIPSAPVSVLPIATIHQTWTDDRVVIVDGVRVVPFDEIVAIKSDVTTLFEEVARNRLEVDISAREAGARVGVFADPCLSDAHRDQGIPQTAAIVDGVITLPIEPSVAPLSKDVGSPVHNAYNPKVLLEQPYRTTCHKINPYMAFDILPASAQLTPAVDRWTENATQWTSAITNRFTVGRRKGKTRVTSTTHTEQVSSVTTALEHLRPIEVQFALSKMYPGEELREITFDGIPVEFQGV